MRNVGKDSEHVPIPYHRHLIRRCRSLGGHINECCEQAAGQSDYATTQPQGETWSGFKKRVHVFTEYAHSGVRVL